MTAQNLQITLEQALCIFYCLPFTEENVAWAIDDLGGFENKVLVYENDPQKPMVLSRTTVNSRPFSYHEYIEEPRALGPEPSRTETISTISRSSMLLSDSQLLELINTAFLPFDPHNAILYKRMAITTHDIFISSKDYMPVDRFKNATSFALWCARKKALFLQQPSKLGKATSFDNRKERVRQLYAFKQLDTIAENISKYQSKYQEEIQNMKAEGYRIVGYCRKSPGMNADQEKQKRLLEAMIARVKERSFARSVFVSCSSRSSSLIQQRDLPRPTLVDELNCAGSTQDLLVMLKNVERVCLVCVDFAGLSTSSDDLLEFIRSYASIKTIIIDQLTYFNKIHIFQRRDILEDPSVLQAFDNCRKGLIQRSK